MELRRFIDKNYDGDFINERFAYVCEDCMVVLSPKFAILDSNESEEEKKFLRDLYFHEKMKKRPQ